MWISRAFARAVDEAGRYTRAQDRRAIRRELAREALFRTAALFMRTIEVRWPSGRYIVSTADRDVSRLTFVKEPFGLATLQAAATLIERHGAGIAGREVLEIGANIGTTTIPLVTVHGVSYVHAFEPGPANYRLLQRNIVANELSHVVTARPVAISHEVGVLPFVASARNAGSSHVAGERNERTLEVPCVTIDSLFREDVVRRARLGLVWIDVEGHEAAVLAGATSLTGVPIVMEYQPKLQVDLIALHDLISMHSSRIFDLTTGSPVSPEQLRNSPTTDLLLMP